MKKIGLALAFAAAIALSFAACSNSSDSGAAAAAAAAAGSGTGNGAGTGTNGGGTNTGTENGGGTQTTPTTQPESGGGNQQGGTDELPEKPWLKAEAVDGGIKFTIKALGAKYNNENDCFVYSKETEPCDIGRFYPEWNDKTKEWTGVYPYVSAGQKYKFALHVKDLQEETVEVTATGGSGQIPYDENTRSCISVDNTGIDVFVDKCPPTVIPTGVTNKKAYTSFFAGEWTRSSWNGEWVDYLEKAEADFAQPDASGNCVYHIASSDALYTKLKEAFTGKYSGKKMFIEFTYRYKLEGFAAECQSRQLRSAPMSVEWTALQNESANFKTEAVNGGIQLTIKAPADSTKYDNCNIHIIMQQNDGMEFGRIYPEWTDKSQAWTCVYPFVDNGKTYKIIFQPHGNLPDETVKCKAGGGSGEIKYPKMDGMDPQVILSFSQSNISVCPFAYPPSLIPASATDKKAYMVYYAGTGWNDATQTWDAQLILERRDTNLYEPELTSSGGHRYTAYSIGNTNPNYTTIQNAMKNTYPEKKIFAQFYYEFKVAGITGTCCSRHMNSEPQDASILRQ